MSYEVVITREGADWLADVPGVAGAHTFARSLARLLDSVREVVILMSDLDEDATVDLTLRYDVDDEVIATAAEVGPREKALGV